MPEYPPSRHPVLLLADFTACLPHPRVRRTADGFGLRFEFSGGHEWATVLFWDEGCAVFMPSDADRNLVQIAECYGYPPRFELARAEYESDDFKEGLVDIEAA